MAVTVRGTDILFNDGTTQSTAATGASTTFGAVGTYAVLCMAANTNLAVDGTIAGSSLRYNYSSSPATAVSWNAGPPTYFQVRNSTGNSYPASGGGTALSGTWRKVSTGPTYWSYTADYIAVYVWSPALFVRIS